MPVQIRRIAIHLRRATPCRPVRRGTGLLLLAFCVTAVPLRGQDVLVNDPADLQYHMPAPTVCDSCDHPLDTCACGGFPWPRFGMYLKSGPSFQLSEDFFANGTNVGYEIAFGGREPLLPDYGNVFFDLGGSYLSAFGDGRPQVVSGTIFSAGNVVPNGVLDEAAILTLNEISRASLHLGLGWYYDFSVEPEISRLLTLRFGGRVSHVRGHFHEQLTPEAQDIIDAGPANQPQRTLGKDRTIGETDTAPGILAGIEWSVSRPLPRHATLAFLIDGEFAADWIDFKNYADSGLVTATLMFGLSVNR